MHRGRLDRRDRIFDYCDAAKLHHPHPRELIDVMAGSIEVPVEGQETKTHSAAQGFQIPPETPHAGGKASDEDVHLMINYIVEKGKPLVKLV